MASNVDSKGINTHNWMSLRHEKDRPGGGLPPPGVDGSVRLLLEGLVIELVQLVVRQLMELVEIGPPLVSVTKIVVEVRLGDLYTQIASDPMSAHCKNVDVVTRDGTECGVGGFNNGGVNAGALACGNVDSHAGAAEDHSTLEFALGDLRTHLETDAVEHLGILVIKCLYSNVGDLPAVTLQMVANIVFQINSREIRGNKDLFILNHSHNRFLRFLFISTYILSFIPLVVNIMQFIRTDTQPKNTGSHQRSRIR